MCNECIGGARLERQFVENDKFAFDNLLFLNGWELNLWSETISNVSSLTIDLNELLVGRRSYFSLREKNCIMEATV